MNDRKVNY